MAGTPGRRSRPTCRRDVHQAGAAQTPAAHRRSGDAPRREGHRLRRWPSVAERRLPPPPLPGVRPAPPRLHSEWVTNEVQSRGAVRAHAPSANGRSSNSCEFPTPRTVPRVQPVIRRRQASALRHAAMRQSRSCPTLPSETESCERDCGRGAAGCALPSSGTPQKVELHQPSMPGWVRQSLPPKLL